MKTFLKENWYKLMIGFSMVTFSLNALIYSATPVKANLPYSYPMNKISNKSTELYGDYDFYLVADFGKYIQFMGHRKDNGNWENIKGMKWYKQ
jgi:hypothetical protein